MDLVVKHYQRTFKQKQYDILLGRWGEFCTDHSEELKSEKFALEELPGSSQASLIFSLVWSRLDSFLAGGNTLCHPLPAASAMITYDFFEIGKVFLKIHTKIEQISVKEKTYQIY